MKSLLVCCAIFLLGTTASAKPVIFDNDMAIDDWAALLYLLKSPDADVIAVTIAAAGESHCEPGLNNTLSLLDLPGNIRQHIPVACGDLHPLDGYSVFPEAWRKDSDTLSGVAVVKSQRTASKQHAVEVIHQALHSTEESVTIVATGPLTNIALWLERYPDDIKRVGQLVIMGGNLDVPGNIIVPLFTAGHPNTTAEWNLFIDPVAADKVFKAGLPITLVGLDVTNSVPVTEQEAADFIKYAKSPAADFWAKVLKKNDWFIASGEYYFWDSLAAMVAVDPELCDGDMQHVKVAYQVTDRPWLQTSNRAIPAERWDDKKRNHLDAKTAGTLLKDQRYPALKICRKTYPKKIFTRFKSVLNR